MIFRIIIPNKLNRLEKTEKCKWETSYKEKFKK